MRILTFEQRTPEWYTAKKGIISASNAEKLLTPSRRLIYAKELLAELLADEREESYISPAMMWGIENEDRAKAMYEFETDNIVQNVGFCLHDVHDFIGASPDGLIGLDGLIEIKCPSSKNHIEYMTEGAPPIYVAQMQFQMLVTNRNWCDFVSFDSRMPANAQLYIERIERDNDMIQKLLAGAHEIKDYMEAFKQKYGVS